MNGCEELVAELPEYSVGTRWRSVACDTEVIIVKAPSAGELNCGGWAMVPVNIEQGRSVVRPPFDKGSQIGKRYQDQAGTLELLCTKAGLGSLALAEEILTVKAPKPLPSSD